MLSPFDWTLSPYFKQFIRVSPKGPSSMKKYLTNTSNSILSQPALNLGKYNAIRISLMKYTVRPLQLAVSKTY